MRRLADLFEWFVFQGCVVGLELQIVAVYSEDVLKQYRVHQLKFGQTEAEAGLKGAVHPDRE